MFTVHTGTVYIFTYPLRGRLHSEIQTWNVFTTSKVLEQDCLLCPTRVYIPIKSYFTLTLYFHQYLIHVRYTRWPARLILTFIQQPCSAYWLPPLPLLWSGEVSVWPHALHFDGFLFGAEGGRYLRKTWTKRSAKRSPEWAERQRQLPPAV